MIEQKLEAIVVEKVKALGFPCVCSTFGNAYEDESADSSVTIDTGTRSQFAWELPQFDINFTVTYEQRIETDATKAEFLARVDALNSLICGYCSRGGASRMSADFTIAGEFSPVYFQVNGGTNAVDRSASVFTFEQTFTIRGIIN